MIHEIYKTCKVIIQNIGEYRHPIIQAQNLMSYHPTKEAHECYSQVLLLDECSMTEDHFGLVEGQVSISLRNILEIDEHKQVNL